VSWFHLDFIWSRYYWVVGTETRNLSIEMEEYSMLNKSHIAIAAVLVVALTLVACGRPTTNPAGGQGVQSSSGATSPTVTPGTELDISPSGDIPDTATFLVYHATSYSLQYVEGWVQEPLPSDGIRFADKDSFVSVMLQDQPASGSLVDYAAGSGATESAKEFQQFVQTGVKAVSLPAGQAALLTFQGLSAPDPVTGKTVTLAIDRYYIPGPNYLAVLTEATPQGVDNVDAFRQIAQSFAWSGK
jgi:hypothetical protein